MAGTKAGARKAAATNKARYGENFYATIGRKGGQNGTTGGFAANRELARKAGRLGGTISRRGRKQKSVSIAVNDVSADSQAITVNR